jgi:hypothetical protein
MNGMKPQVVLVLLPLGAMTFAAACDKVQPAGSTLVKDVPPAPPEPPADDGGQPLLDGPIYGDAPVYTPFDADLGACSSCACAQGTSFCFGGGSTKAPTGDGGDAGPKPCTTASTAIPEVGCNTLPAACAAKPTCACIIDTLQPSFRCYLNCQDDGKQFLVYCPN